MDYQKYQGSIHQLKRLNRYLVIALVAMSLVLVGMSACIYRVIGYKTVTLVPPILSQQMTISDVMPDQAYLEQMGLFLTELRLNITPANVDQNFKTFLLHVAPESYGKIEQSLNQEGKVIKKGDISAAFYPTGQSVDIEGSAILVTGRLDKRVGTRLISSRDETFKLLVDYRNGSLYVVDFYQIETKKQG